VMGLSRINPLEGRKTGFHDFLVEEHKGRHTLCQCQRLFRGPNMFATKPINSPKNQRTAFAIPHIHLFQGIGLVGVTIEHADLHRPGTGPFVIV
jgi:hypothetical protein